MKKYILLFFIFSSGTILYCQNILDKVHPILAGELNGDTIRKFYELSTGPSFTRDKGYINYGLEEPEIILGLFHSNNLFAETNLTGNKTMPELVQFGLDPFPYYKKRDTTRPLPFPGYLAAIPVFDSLGVLVVASGINRTNAHKYEFRVTENRKKEIIPWRDINLFCEAYTSRTNADGTEETETAYLGEFRTSFGNGLTIEVRKKSTDLLLASISALWINTTPNVLATFSNKNMPDFLLVFKQQWKHDYFQMGGGTYFGDYDDGPVDSLFIKREKFPSSENSIIFYLKGKVKSKGIIEYNLIRGNKSNGWKANDYNMNLIWLQNLSPGDYTLQMRYSLQRQNISEYTFIIAAAWHQTLAFKIIAGIIGMIAICFFYILFISARQKQKIKQEQLQKKLVQTEIKSIRSQFNPHFVFNALGSIQGLITKNDMEGANQYLTAFSSLMRDSLKASGQEFVSITTEIKMLDTYLTLEKLRFGFTYTIKVDESINATAIEVPALLLQPIAENAVKHGIASLYEKGILTIDFTADKADMLVAITDNGKGYITSNATEGFGVKMTKDRIQLLNTTLQGQLIEFTIQSNDTGTTVHLLFKNWLV